MMMLLMVMVVVVMVEDRGCPRDVTKEAVTCHKRKSIGKAHTQKGRFGQKA
jgi:hypothetical protein